MRLIVFCIACTRLFSTVIMVPDLTHEINQRYLDICIKDKKLPEEVSTYLTGSFKVSKDVLENDLNFPFNGEKPFCRSIEILKDKFKLTAAVETGAKYGQTSRFLAGIFPKVITLEIMPEYITLASDYLEDLDNLSLVLGDSSRELSDHIESIKDERPLFYLDAHWYKNWPLKREIIQISKYFKDNCIIVVDDVKVPGTDIFFDKYNKRHLSYNYLKNELEKCFTNHQYYFLITKKKFRGKLLVIPSKFIEDGLSIEDLLLVN